MLQKSSLITNQQTLFQVKKNFFTGEDELPIDCNFSCFLYTNTFFFFFSGGGALNTMNVDHDLPS